jgi:hypothetical protein
MKNKVAFKESLAEYLEPISIAANSTRIRLGLQPIDITEREDIMHQIKYFQNGFNDGQAGYWDKWYEDKKAFSAYRAGNFAGRKLFSGEFQTIGC